MIHAVAILFGLLRVVLLILEGSLALTTFVLVALEKASVKLDSFCDGRSYPLVDRIFNYITNIIRTTADKLLLKLFV